MQTETRFVYWLGNLHSTIVCYEHFALIYVLTHLCTHTAYLCTHTAVKFLIDRVLTHLCTQTTVSFLIDRVLTFLCTQFFFTDRVLTKPIDIEFLPCWSLMTYCRSTIVTSIFSTMFHKFVNSVFWTNKWI